MVISKTAERPMSTPPAMADIGVNSVSIMIVPLPLNRQVRIKGQ
jgi:hypothetical protein